MTKVIKPEKPKLAQKFIEMAIGIKLSIYGLLMIKTKLFCKKEVRIKIATLICGIFPVLGI